MDSSRIKRLATGVRDELRREVEGRLEAVLAADSPERLSDGTGVVRLEARIEAEGRDAVVEAGAYTWFNRLCALRFMDARGYTPTPAVTPRAGSTMPAVLADAAQGSFDPEYGLAPAVRERVVSLLSGSTQRANATEAAYAELLRAVCAHYAKPMPYLFSEDAASSLLMPRGLLSEGSILGRIVAEMDAGACSSVEVLGWLYQFYIAERKDEVFAGFKKNKKAGPAEIGPATQLFTPEWIVRYLCENSLGRLWMLNHPGSPLAERMDYYIAPEGDEPHIEVSSAEEVRVLDPACGSGHILVYAFDLLYSMYEEEGWLPEEIPAMILQNNLKGLEIDARAAEIAKFALEMKALERDPRFLERDVDADVTVLRPVALDEADMPYLSQSFKERVGLIEAMAHMGEVGSLYVPEAGDARAVAAEIERLAPKAQSDMFARDLAGRLGAMLENVEALSGSYHCVVANPPYMGTSTLYKPASDFVKENYPDEKADLCTCFIERAKRFNLRRGYSALITMQSWMFLSSYEKMREKIINHECIISMAHLGARAFDAIGGEVVSTTATIFQHIKDSEREGTYIRLVDFLGEANKSSICRKAICDASSTWLYRAYVSDYKIIPGMPIAYWVGNGMKSAFLNGTPLSVDGRPRKGLTTTDNGHFLRLWHEVSADKVCLTAENADVAKASRCKWFPYDKGGDFRKWYGNRECFVNWEDDGAEVKALITSKYNGGSYTKEVRSEEMYFAESLTWTELCTGMPGFRYSPAGTIFDSSGSSMFPRSHILYYLGLMNSSVMSEILKMLNPTLHYNSGVVAKAPALFSEFDLRLVEAAVSENVSLAKSDWDSFETSWDFETHPLVRTECVADAYTLWQSECRDRFEILKSNEEELNRIFARIYGMEGEVPIEVPDDKVSVRLADLQRDVRSLISYGVGCIFGRYSLDAPGLVLADQGATVADYLVKVPEPTLVPDADNILPVLDAEWFDDDIVTQFYRFLAAAYGESTLDENVAFIEGALGCDLRTYFVRDFYSDHVKTYQKRPIYWLFQSPQKSFSCLVYMHRYNEGTVGEVLTKYLRAYEDKLRLRVQVLSRSERAADLKAADRMRAQISELEAWEKEVVYPLAHERVAIDLDDGVKINYNKFPHALAKVQGLSDWK
ncbi:Type I restriction-modification system methyltransferase subunit [Slackia heliotrinireducens]|uniref:site-specific DNA-methyltransferase (adenine-specific) n=1 Tax=Slackia heliotrinireducens (strain ATCC 29202 / DSM 20476 / NCTC 11029 / RHS 1) TaxID=471855 RepID=C7N256_SLAHD|nr:BREX-1 system adenine-specific DNA-methyltransferase PglX [Slackia heliotrinireducens]ACV21362.1 hypothetical protein Shel_02940 [Slackia heliotrinireducens DSM 20476]VEG98794.1 Type I restriction-modification system methyltransferase subunit [Slackia heliotrinireducens]